MKNMEQDIKLWFLIILFHSVKKQCPAVSILYSNYRINTAFKVFFSSVPSWKYTSTPDLMGSHCTAGIFEIDCRLSLSIKNKQHHEQNKSTGAAGKCNHCSESELVVTETENHSLLPAAQGPISLHFSLKRCPHSSAWALCAPMDCFKCSRSSTAWF